LALENLALRQQLATVVRKMRRPKIRTADRCFWVWLSRFWHKWADSLLIVQPATVIRWHREGFRSYWRWRSRAKRPGRPTIDPAVIALIRRMSCENPTWGAPRIQAELGLLGHEVAETTVAKYMGKHRKPPSQSWRTFLKNHVEALASVDFFTVPTATFQVLYVFVILRHDRRRVVHFDVTAKPTAAWVAQRIREAFPSGVAPRYLIRDREDVYGEAFHQCLAELGINEVKTSPRSPWQNPFVERLIGSIRRECLDHLIVLNAAHLKRMLRSFLDYYHDTRPHQSLAANSPNAREIEPPHRGKVVAIPQVGGLHHLYRRCA
jgi:transposase InsO family protein